MEARKRNQPCRDGASQSWIELEHSAEPLDPGTPQPQQVQHSLNTAAYWLLSQQARGGYWCAILEGDSILESEYILLQAYLGKLDSPKVALAAKALEQSQCEHGGWAMYPGGPLEISASVKAYFALKLAGRTADQSHMVQARNAIRGAGGADRVNSFTRFYLALLGQIGYEYCPAVPPEAVLLPKWLPINMYRISAWSRTMVVPLAVMWAHRPLRKLAPEQGIAELMLQPTAQWPALRSPCLPPRQRLFSWETAFRLADRFAKFLERNRIQPLRRMALKCAQQWMVNRFVDSDGLGAIYPPIVWSRIALDCLGYAEASPEVRYCDEQLDVLLYQIDGADHLRIQPCQSPVWDTTIAMRALDAAGVSPCDPHMKAATDWLLAKQTTRKGDWSERAKVEPGGWFFEFHNEFYPDIDDTIMALMALRTQSPNAPTMQAVTSARFDSMDAARVHISQQCEAEQVNMQTAVAKGIDWVVALQNSDGGWGAFDKDNDAEFLCAVPFADHNAMIDPSTPDITARVLEALADWGWTQGQSPVDRAVRYLRASQESDGSWFGRWGVNHIYGTWQVLVGLRAVGVSQQDAAMRNGAAWLERMQQPSGGWGESPASYEDPSQRGRGPTTASQTAWAILGLLAARDPMSPSILHGINYLLKSQNSAGTWDESEFTGTGFPRVFYLRYHMYPHYFPMLAIGTFARLMWGAQWTSQLKQRRIVWPRVVAQTLQSISSSVTDTSP